MLPNSDGHDHERLQHSTRALRASIELTVGESGTSAMQLMAAVESRRLVGATLSLTDTQMRRAIDCPK
jgi:hypothetical protein